MLFDKLYTNLNDMQREAVYTVKGPLLVLAGAGSGKTTVLVNRIMQIIKFGNGYYDDFTPPDAEKKAMELKRLYVEGTREEIIRTLSDYAVDSVDGGNVLCITFTNKAASEFKERLESLLGEESSSIWAGTFHSICVRILRREAGHIGISNNFTIYDTDDVKKLITQIMKDLNIDTKTVSVKTIINMISHAKEQCIRAEEFEVGQNDYRYKKIADIYREYEKRLKAASAMDFDDIILNTILLFTEHPAILDKYSGRFEYILVDEYQDTNPIQNDLVIMLSGRRGNVAVVGDDDQSIYSFRGATVENILNFDRHFKNLKVIKLEQNYRSTQNILSAANAVISNNFDRKGKELWTKGEEGKKITCKCLYTQTEEAAFIIENIRRLVQEEGYRYRDIAVLYRVNAMANAIETAFTKTRTPYRIYGGIRFFERKEIKDIIAYLSVISNKNDDIRLRRIINVPKRQIGDTTVDLIASIAAREGRSMFEIVSDCASYPELSRNIPKLERFYAVMAELEEFAAGHSLEELIVETIDRTGYLDMLLDNDEHDKVELVMELKSAGVLYEEGTEEPSLAGFLEEISLVSDIDNYDADSDSVSLMTVHSSKGLEFPAVFIAGMEEGVFPSMMSLQEGKSEEERRLAYVAITRAKRELYLTYTQSRILYGQTSPSIPSSYLAEIPDELKFYEPVRERVKINREIPVKNKDFIRTKEAGTVKFDLKKGDRVKHGVFGDGLILSREDMGGDMLLEVEFDSGEVKKLMASFAKLTKI